MLQIIYVSAASRPMSNAHLHVLLTSAQKRNLELDVTGILVHHGGSFLQVLEGPESEVSALFAKICADERHTNVGIVVKAYIEKREFECWSMAYANPSQEDLTDLGILDYDMELPLLAADPTRAKTVLRAFCDGQLRKSAA